MRLTDADALKLAIPETSVDAFQNCRNCTLLSKEQVLELIDAAPTIEVNRPTRSQFKRMAVQLGYEPVVHCKDCKYVKHWKDHTGIEGLLCRNFAIDTNPEAFCSLGERKDDAHEPMGA